MSAEDWQDRSMKRKAPPNRESGMLCRWRLLRMPILTVAVVSTLLLAGCQRGNLIKARSLPPALAATPCVNVQSLDLSRLAQPQADGKLIQPGDQIEMVVASGAPDETLQPFVVTVTDDGSADIPLVGSVQLVGLETDQARDVVRNASIERGIFRQPSVNLELKSRKMHHVTVLGAVAAPGSYELPAHSCDLLSAIVAAGGLTESAGPIVKVQKGGPNTNPTQPSETMSASYQTNMTGSASRVAANTMQIDLLAATQGGSIPPIALGDGDIVNVSEVEKRVVYVMGLVKAPKNYEMPAGQDLTLLDALAMAGGVTETVADRILIVRSMPGQSQPTMIAVSLREAKRNGQENLMLASGDVVTVEDTPLTYTVSTIKQLIRIGVNGSVAAF